MRRQQLRARRHSGGWGEIPHLTLAAQQFNMIFIFALFNFSFTTGVAWRRAQERLRDVFHPVGGLGGGDGCFFCLGGDPNAHVRLPRPSQFNPDICFSAAHLEHKSVSACPQCIMQHHSPRFTCSTYMHYIYFLSPLSFSFCSPLPVFCFPCCFPSFRMLAFFPWWNFPLAVAR